MKYLICSAVGNCHLQKRTVKEVGENALPLQGAFQKFLICHQYMLQTTNQLNDITAYLHLPSITTKDENVLPSAWHMYK
jgi:hypothetical protein